VPPMKSEESTLIHLLPVGDSEGHLVHILSGASWPLSFGVPSLFTAVVQEPADRWIYRVSGLVIAKDAAKHLSRALRVGEAHEDHSGVADPAGPIHDEELIPQDRPVARQELRRGDWPILRSWSFLNNRRGPWLGHRPHTLAWSNRLAVFHMPHITVSNLRATACQALASWIPFLINRP